jgi:hypothetical protein
MEKRNDSAAAASVSSEKDFQDKVVETAGLAWSLHRLLEDAAIHSGRDCHLTFTGCPDVATATHGNAVEHLNSLARAIYERMLELMETF